ncbi:MAG: CatB-related O-acetyltransferase [Candidatus Jordarchaeaceae archaeon]
MVSFKVILYNLLKARKPHRCSVSIGRHSGIPYIISAERTDRVVIGNFCSIAHGVILITHQGHIPPPEKRDYRVATYAMALVGRHGFKPSYWIRDRKNFVYIGNDVVLGAYSIILPGVKVGDGAIVGAGAVVTRDVPPYAIVAGVPAKIIRFRYSQEQIEKLLKIAWWN